MGNHHARFFHFKINSSGKIMKNIMAQLSRLITSAKAFDKSSARFTNEEQIRIKQHDCRANMPAAASRGQGLYEAKHGKGGIPFQSQPKHIRDSYEQAAASGKSGYNFRGNNSAYKKFWH